MRKLGNWIDHYMHYTENSEPPNLFRKWCAISTIAAAMQRKCWLHWGTDMTLYPNMFIVLVGPPATRKGTAMNPAERLLRDLEIKFAASATTKEALIQSITSAETFTNLVNGEICIHSSLTVFSKELTVFLGQSNYGLLAHLTDWFDCASEWSYRTKSGGLEEIKGVWLNLIGATTPELVRTSLPMEAIGGGFTSRCIFIYEEKKGKVVPFPMEQEGERQLRSELLYDLEAIHNMSGNFKVSPQFIDMWGTYYVSSQDEEIFPPNSMQHFGGYIERRATHALKLAMIMNAARTDDMYIHDCDLMAALDLLRLTEIKMPKTFSGIGRGKDAEVYAKMLRYMADRKQTSVTELVSVFRSDGSYQELLETAKSLVATGVAEWIDKRALTLKKRERSNGL